MFDETDWLPLEAEEDAAQQAAALRLVHGPPRIERALDVGAGSGRIARPVAMRGVRVVALDTDPEALERCQGENIDCVRGDALDEGTNLASMGPFDAAWCLGHTFLLFHDVGRAFGFMRRLRAAMRPGAWFAIDNFPGPLWREVAEGAWQTGVSEDGQWQMIWVEGDSVIALRRGKEVRPGDWNVRETDRLLRLWSMGDLAMLAAAAGFDRPAPDPTGTLLLFRNP